MSGLTVKDHRRYLRLWFRHLRRYHEVLLDGPVLSLETVLCFMYVFISVKSSSSVFITQTVVISILLVPVLFVKCSVFILVINSALVGISALSVTVSVSNDNFDSRPPVYQCEQKVHDC